MKVKVLLLGIVATLMLGSSMNVCAADHVHNFIKETYSHTTYREMSHQYLYGVYEDGSKEYRTCYYTYATVHLNMVCSICDVDSGVDKQIDGGDSGHDCPPSERPVG